MLLDPKSKVLKSPKIGTFSNWLVQDFCQKKSNILSRIFLRQIKSEKMFFDVLDRIECFLDHTAKFLKGPENGNFSKRLVHGFCQKIEYSIKGVYFAN